MTSGWGGRKFLRPRTMKDPVGRYSPLGAVFDTCVAACLVGCCITSSGLRTHTVSGSIFSKYRQGLIC